MYLTLKILGLFCQLFVLTQNMRLQIGKSDKEEKQIADFSKLLAIGDGKLKLPLN